MKEKLEFYSPTPKFEELLNTIKEIQFWESINGDDE